MTCELLGAMFKWWTYSDLEREQHRLRAAAQTRYTVSSSSYVQFVFHAGDAPL